MRSLLLRLLTLSFCWASAAGFAQVKLEEQTASYEGQNVSAISLIANPHRDLQPLIPLVQQKQGAPFSEKAVEASREALTNAGNFQDVQVRVVPEVSGLRVLFVLEPAYYLGVVEFPGVLKLFSYTRLVQVANLSDEDPYDPSQIPVAETALIDFLRRNGYFQASVHATMKGPLKDRSRVEAHLSIPLFKASYQSLQLGIADPIKVDYANSVVTIQPAEIQGSGTSLRVEGRVPIAGSASPTLTAKGSVDLRVLKVFAPDLTSSGNLALDVRTGGTAAKPEIRGSIQLKNVAMTTEDAPVGIERLTGTLDLTSDRVQISQLTGQMGGGQVTFGGSIVYRPTLQFNLAMQSDGMRLLYPDGLRSLLNVNLALRGTAAASTLSGRIVVDSLNFTPDFDLGKFADQFSTGATVSQPGFADTIRLSIAVQSENLSATSSQISIGGRAALQVGGTAANPVITGRATLTSGELFYRTVRYQLQRGIITFDNPNVTHPVLNVAVITTIEQYNLTLTLRGPLEKLTTSYVSDPPLATADVINLVARGKTTQEQAASSQSTDSMIASQAAGQLSSSVQKLAGISSLQIDPTIGGNNKNPSARIAIQQRVTKNFLFTFSTDVSEPGSEIIQGEYQINRRWSVSVARDQLGGVSVDGKYHKRF